MAAEITGAVMLSEAKHPKELFPTRAALAFYMKLSAVLQPGDAMGFFAPLRMTP